MRILRGFICPVQVSAMTYLSHSPVMSPRTPRAMTPPQALHTAKTNRTPKKCSLYHTWFRNERSRVECPAPGAVQSPHKVHFLPSSSQGSTAPAALGIYLYTSNNLGRRRGP